MVDVTIDDLPDGGAGLGPDEFEIWRVGTSLRLDLASIAQYANGLLTAGAPTGLDTFAEVAAAVTAKAPIASPTFTGTPAAPTPTAGVRSTALATTEYVDRDRWRVLARGNVAIPLTGTTSETDYVLVTVPAGAMGPNGAIRITTLASAGANNANAKNIRYRFGGNAFQNFSLASTLSNEGMRTIANRNSASSQVAASAGTSTFGNINAAVAVSAIDTTAAVDIRITGLLANAGDTLTLERYLIEILYGA